MNEKIREIALEAGGSTYPEVNTTQLVKFAELIIRECAVVATHNQYQPHTAGHYVLKHFGLKE